MRQRERERNGGGNGRSHGSFFFSLSLFLFLSLSLSLSLCVCVRTCRILLLCGLDWTMELVVVYCVPDACVYVRVHACFPNNNNDDDDDDDDDTTHSVLLIDCSLQADSSCLMLGGTQEPSVANSGARTRGRQSLNKLASDGKTAANLFAAILAEKERGNTLLGRFKGFMSSGKGVNVMDHIVNLSSFCSEGEDAGTLCKWDSNVYLAPGGIDLKDALTMDNWYAAATDLREALDAMPGRWVVFFDTDGEVAERPPSLLALGIAERLILLLSSSWNDYNRLFDDPINSLFEILKTMISEGKSCARIYKILFNRIKVRAHQPTKLHEVSGDRDAMLVFSPVKGVQQQMEQMVDHLFNTAWNDMNSKGADFKDIFIGHGLINNEGEFADIYVDAFVDVPDMVMHVSTLTGIPFVYLDHKLEYLASTGEGVKGLKISKDVLENVVTEIQHLSDKL